MKVLSQANALFRLQISDRRQQIRRRVKLEFEKRIANAHRLCTLANLNALHRAFNRVLFGFRRIAQVNEVNRVAQRRHVHGKHQKRLSSIGIGQCLPREKFKIKSNISITINNIKHT